MPTDKLYERVIASPTDDAAHYSIMRVARGKGEEALRAMFPNAEADEMNFVLFSTSGVHGSYSTIEECEAHIGNPNESASVTFVIVQPRLVCMRYGNVEVTAENANYLKALRASSWMLASAIGSE